MDYALLECSLAWGLDNAENSMPYFVMLSRVARIESTLNAMGNTSMLAGFNDYSRKALRERDRILSLVVEDFVFTHQQGLWE